MPILFLPPALPRAVPRRARLTARRAPRATLPDVSHTTAPTRTDGPFAAASIAMFRAVMRPSVGWTSPRQGYAGLVEECRMLLARKGPAEQRAVVMGVLERMFFAPVGVRVFRERFAHASLNAAVTPLAFSWLVGKSRVNVPEEGGKGVFIEKCRFLEESGCKGLCVNMCQQPTQAFFTDVLGLPLRMTPDYEDSSCQMAFGVSPLPVSDDPAVTGDCLADCKMSSVALKGRSECYVTKEL